MGWDAILMIRRRNKRFEKDIELAVKLMLIELEVIKEMETITDVPASFLSD